MLGSCGYPSGQGKEVGNLCFCWECRPEFSVIYSTTLSCLGGPVSSLVSTPICPDGPVSSLVTILSFFGGPVNSLVFTLSCLGGPVSSLVSTLSCVGVPVGKWSPH